MSSLQMPELLTTGKPTWTSTLSLFTSITESIRSDHLFSSRPFILFCLNVKLANLLRSQQLQQVSKIFFQFQILSTDRVRLLLTLSLEASIKNIVEKGL